MKTLSFAFATLATMIVCADLAFLHGLTATILTAIVSLF